MIYFGISKELDIRSFKLAKAFDENFSSVGAYLLSGNVFVILGGSESVAFNPAKRAVGLEAPFKNFDLAESDKKLLLRDSPQEKLLRMIISALREWYEVDPFVNHTEFELILAETNKMLSDFGMKLSHNSQGMRLLNGDKIISYEKGLSFLLENSALEDVEISLAEWSKEAEYYRETLQDEKAMEVYDRILKYAGSGTWIYTEALFRLGELYYFGSRYDEALRSYYRCDLKSIPDLRDFYIHMGHAFLDAMMKNYEDQIKLYYRGRLSHEFYERNMGAIELAAGELEENFEEYQEACYRVGQYKYNESRSRFIGTKKLENDIVVSEGGENRRGRYKPLKRYQRITLIPRRNIGISAGEDRDTLLKSGLRQMNLGEYQKAYEAYIKLSEAVTLKEREYTWAMLQLAKLYSFFEEYDMTLEYLKKCNTDDFGIIYRIEDYMLLYVHSRIVLDDFESDKRYRLLIRGKYDHYFAQYDRDYYLMTRDRNLMDSFYRYEKECIEDVLNTADHIYDKRARG